MLGIIEAKQTYNNNPADPYVILPGDEAIEVRFSDDGMITAAYMIGGGKWGSQEFITGVAKSQEGAKLDVLPRKEELTTVRQAAQLEGPRKAQRVRLDAATAFGRPIIR